MLIEMINEKIAQELQSAEFDMAQEQINEFNKTAKLSGASVEYRKGKIARIVLEISA